LVPAARLQLSASGPLSTRRNSAWREGVKFSQKAMETGELVLRPITDEHPTAIVAAPLSHEDQMLGSLLIRLRQDFSEEDRPLLMAVGAQMARNLQREAALVAEPNTGIGTYVSAGAAEERL